MRGKDEKNTLLAIGEEAKQAIFAASKMFYAAAIFFCLGAHSTEAKTLAERKKAHTKPRNECSWHKMWMGGVRRIFKLAYSTPHHSSTFKPTSNCSSSSLFALANSSLAPSFQRPFNFYFLSCLQARIKSIPTGIIRHFGPKWMINVISSFCTSK